MPKAFDRKQVTGGDYVPTQSEMWDFLLGFKEAVDAGFARTQQ